jgi:DNA-binding SARP family transcriptional activator/tetratricopeptide (TPR) repeat protein
MWIGLLGPLTVRHEDGAVTLPAAKQRIVLACLALHAGEVVSLDQLVDVLWDGSPPPGARATVRNYVKRLRQLLGPGPGARIVTHHPGYLMDLAEDEVDVLRFAALYRTGDTALRAGEWQQAHDSLAEALGLWRGAPLVDVPSLALRHDAVPQLEQLRLQAIEARIEADLNLGRHHRLVPELQALIAEHPLRERPREQLMLALYRCGRQAEVLEEYRAVRRLLRDELGVEPGPGLRDLHERVLAADPALLPRAAGRTESATRVPLAQLPADIPDFTGRADLVGRLSAALVGDADRDGDEDRNGAGAGADQAGSGGVVVAAVSGGGGVGKTSLAVHVGHQLRARFPDGQLFVDLCGAGPHPVASGDVLARFLRDLGVAADAVPVDEQERAARYRTLLADRRVLILLDNARDAAQVRALLPGSGSCRVVVTSRNRLADLAGAAPFDLDVLDDPEARALFARIVGAARADAEPVAVEQVLRACAGLPLAIRIAAGRLAGRTSWSVRTLADRLADERRRLDELAVGDLAVRAGFGVSYADLMAGDRTGSARCFRLLGLVDGPDIEVRAAAALLGEPPDRAEAALETLVDAHLARTPSPGRYNVHDLLRVYAAERAEAEETAEDRAAARDRLLTWYLRTTIAAIDVINPLRRGTRRAEDPPAEPAARFADYDEALAWIDQELPNLLAAVQQAAGHDRHTIAWRLPSELWDYVTLRGGLTNLIDMYRTALSSARADGEAEAEGIILGYLTTGYRRAARYREALECSEAAFEIWGWLGSVRGQALAWHAVGAVHREAGDTDLAIQGLERALALYRRAGRQDGEVTALYSLGATYRAAKRFAEALSVLERCLALVAGLGDRRTECDTLADLSQVHLGLGDTARAVEHARRAIELNRRIGHTRGEASALLVLARALREAGQADEARGRLIEAEAILVGLGDPRAAAMRAEIDGL